MVQLASDKTMNLGTVRHFVLDECDKMLENLGEFPLSLTSLHSSVLPYIIKMLLARLLQ